jgi:hypothetical protein
MMNDCPNADVRDLLPDLAHGRLGGDARTQVERHLATCANCRAELELIRAVSRSLAAAPAVDVGRIVAALPSSYARQVRPLGVRGLGGWRRAAAIVAVTAGLVATGVWSRSRGDATGSGAGPAASSTIAASESLAAPSGPADTIGSRQDARDTQPRPEKQRTATATAEAPLLAVGELGDLSVAQLNSVLASLEDIDGIPSAEPTAIPSPTNSEGRLQ